MTGQLFEFPTAPVPAPTPKKQPKPKGYTGEFLAFWELYPPRINSSKFLAFKAWAKLDADEQRQAMAAAPIYASSRRGKDQEYTAHAATWLNGKYFETISPPIIAKTISAPPDWSKIMKLYWITNNWHQEHGPAPGLTGCNVPAEFLSDM